MVSLLSQKHSLLGDIGYPKNKNYELFIEANSKKFKYVLVLFIFIQRCWQETMNIIILNII
jgi:hypothetical protein